MCLKDKLIILINATVSQIMLKTTCGVDKITKLLAVRLIILTFSFRSFTKLCAK